MSDPADTPRPVSALSAAAILALFGLFLALAYEAHVRHPAPLAQNIVPEGVPADQAWETTPAGRAAYLAKLRAGQEEQATTYAWIDRKAGVVRIPIERAMELTAQEYQDKK